MTKKKSFIRSHVNVVVNILESRRPLDVPLKWIKSYDSIISKTILNSKKHYQFITSRDGIVDKQMCVHVRARIYVNTG